MAVLGRLGGGHGPDRNIVSKASAVSRLLGAYTAQLEILRRLRNGGPQVVRVEHVHVNEGGGQAIIGNVRSGTAGEEHPSSRMSNERRCRHGARTAHHSTDFIRGGVRIFRENPDTADSEEKALFLTRAMCTSVIFFAFPKRGSGSRDLAEGT